MKQSIKEVYDLDYKIIAKSKLCGYNTLLTAIENLKERIKELDALLVTMGSGYCDNVKVQGGLDNIEENRRLSLLAEKEQLMSILRFRRSDVKRINRALNSLKGESRTILDKFYINRMDNYLVNLMDELGYERRAIYYRHDEALRDFAFAMYGMTED